MTKKNIIIALIIVALVLAAYMIFLSGVPNQLMQGRLNRQVQSVRNGVGTNYKSDTESCDELWSRYWACEGARGSNDATCQRIWKTYKEFCE